MPQMGFDIQRGEPVTVGEMQVTPLAKTFRFPIPVSLEAWSGTGVCCRSARGGRERMVAASTGCYPPGADCAAGDGPDRCTADRAGFRANARDAIFSVSTNYLSGGFDMAKKKTELEEVAPAAIVPAEEAQTAVIPVVEAPMTSPWLYPSRWN